MPQHKVRSVGYRSFFTCNDPSGVVECGTIKKSKTGTQRVENDIDCQRSKKEHSNPSLACKEERKEFISKGNTEELHNLPSSKLSEVSRGTQKINHMIDSLSKGLSFDGPPKDVARDLLKGALDLQESLIMLDKLQEASKYMAQLKKKQKPRSEQGEGEEVVIDRVDSGRFGEKYHRRGLHMRHLSFDDSSRDCREELKKIIKDSLSRQNLFPISKEEKSSNSESGREFDSTVDIPSTSSSQSLMVHSRSSVFDGSTAQDKKVKSPNLIAKLMGLEELPSEQIQPSKKQVESDKSSNQWRPIYDIDMPNVRKPNLVDSIGDSEQRTLREIIEAMQFKGLLKNSHSVSHLSNTSCSKQRLDGEIPPIVIIKPLNFPYEKTEGPLLERFNQEEGDFDTKEIITELEVKEVHPPKIFPRKEEAPELKEMLGRLEAKQEPLTEMFMGEKGALDPKQMLRELETKEVAATKRIIQEEGAKDSKTSPSETQKVKELKTKKLREPEVKEFKNKEKACPNKMKSSASLNHRLPRNKKSEKTKMVPSDRRKPVEKDHVKCVAGPRSQNWAKSTSVKLIKPESELVITKNQFPLQRSTIRGPKSIHPTKPVSQNSADRRKKSHTKKAIPAREPLPTSSIMENLQCKDSVLATTRVSLVDQVPAGERRTVFEIDIEDHCSKDNSVSKTTPCITQHERGIGHEGEATQLINHETIGRNTIRTSTMKALLLSSPSFLSCVADLFDVNVDQPTVSKEPSVLDVGMTNVRLFLDCANEIMERKSLQTLQLGHPLFGFRDSRIIISLDKVVEEVCCGVENLNNYNKINGVLPMDILYIMLEKDLSCKLVLNGTWDLGWINGFSVDEADQIVGELEKQVLDGLVQEVILDLTS
ncbi:PREDICTED: uncharacterized protein LOC104595174 [Nelumbo nucifera]|uniref:Uncharacterized protein LOC104595174 n=1 Tax=Nelumbo nucifera TaxID=4432 RepID=A0A1U8Q2T5_NELNU|nr:PREDICTED: uncharacterized protein LOC104595174 [Nelumbo nucifera]XP_010254088.1 PREDICTED: uncharacterized protein LOC104595174 [Nelumbo nucifera]XP_019052932.1 PREDICTED: uncharacterized protein LOC104595174 [Nelumbo nucifera]